MSGYIVGLTGGIGSGKSTVADLFVEFGAALVDTDAIAHELTAPNGAAMGEIATAFGRSVLTAEGALDRAEMRRRVFADHGARNRLEGILHPLIRRLSIERCGLSTAPYVILAVPLLIESGAYRERCDRIVVVDCSPAVQIARVQARSGLSVSEVEAIMAAQVSRVERLAVADDVISNEDGRQMLPPQVERLHRKYLHLSAEKLKASC